MSETTGPATAGRYHPNDATLPERFWPTITAMREQCPVAHTDAWPGWVLTRYEDVWAAGRDWETFSSAHGVVLPRDDSIPKSIPIHMDPPEQTLFRRLLNPWFSPQVVEPLEPAIRQVATRLLDEVIESGSCDVVRSYAVALPAEVFFRFVLGQATGFEDALGLLNDVSGRDLSSPEAVAVFRRIGAMIKVVLDRRRSAARQTDVVDAVVHGTVDGRPLAEDEQLRIMGLLLAGGLETSANAIASICLHLASNPALRDRLRGEPALLPDAIEEFLRIDPPVINLARTATRDVEVGGQHIRAGDWILLSFAGANRDPAQFSNPDEIVIDRAENRHLSFGVGVHRCVGSNLARLQIRVAIEEVLRRMPGLDLVDRQPIRYHQGFNRGPAAVHVRFSPGRRSTTTGADT